MMNLLARLTSLQRVRDVYRYYSPPSASSPAKSTVDFMYLWVIETCPKIAGVFTLKPVLVRRFRLADLPQILEIESEAFPDDAYTREIFLELYAECPPGQFLVAERSGRVVGYVVTSLDGRKAEIISIAVDRRHREKGVGKALMLNTLTMLQASGVHRVQLTVRRSTWGAVRFYRNFGFIDVRRIPRYYPEGSDASQMRLTLKLKRFRDE